MDVVAVGAVGRDLVLEVPDVPPAGGATAVRSRHEVLGGKSANQAVACRRLGCETALVGVVGDDEAGTALLQEATADGLDVRRVVRRPGVATALLVDVVAADGSRRLLEHVPDGTLLTAADVTAAADVVRSARAVLLQLQQPPAAVLAALDLLRGTDALVVADGAATQPGTRDAVLRGAHVLRADAAEAGLLVGHDVADAAGARRAARTLLAAGPAVVAVAAGPDGDLVAWRDGDGDGTDDVLVPHLTARPVDPTGGGDAFVAALAVALLRRRPAREAAWWAARASAATVARAGGRPPADLATAVRG